VSSGAANWISRTADAVLTNHRMVKAENGAGWQCMFCSVRMSTPGMCPPTAEPCVPRRWGDQP